MNDNYHTCIKVKHLVIRYNFQVCVKRKERKPWLYSAIHFTAGYCDKLIVVTAFGNGMSRCSVGHIRCDFDCGK